MYIYIYIQRERQTEYSVTYPNRGLPDPGHSRRAVHSSIRSIHILQSCRVFVCVPCFSSHLLIPYSATYANRGLPNPRHSRRPQTL